MRGKKAPRRKLIPDAVYNDVQVTKFINYSMQSGKKSIAEKNVYEAIEEAAKELKLKPTEVFTRAIENIKPKIEVRSRRVGGANYQVPTPVSPDRQEALAMRWIITAAREARKTTSFGKSLAKELVSAYKKEGNAFRKKEDTHKMADANKAFAHFSW